MYLHCADLHCPFSLAVCDPPQGARTPFENPLRTARRRNAPAVGVSSRYIKSVCFSYIGRLSSVFIFVDVL